MRRASAALLWILLVSGCATSRATVSMTQETVDRLGRREFPAPRAEVYRATARALQALGYPVLSSDPAEAQIHTGRRTLRFGDPRTYSGRAWGAPLIGRGGAGPSRLEREYWITLQESASAATTVMANPYLFSEGQNVSGQSVWDLEMEKDAWTRLFDAIARQLRRTPPNRWAPAPQRPDGNTWTGTPPPPQDDRSFPTPPPGWENSGSPPAAPTSPAPDDGPAPAQLSPSPGSAPMPPPPEPIESTPEFSNPFAPPQ